MTNTPNQIYRYSFSIIVIIICTIVFTSTIFVLYTKKGWIHRSCDLSRSQNSSKTNQRARQNSRSGSANSQVIMFKKIVCRCMLYPAGNVIKTRMVVYDLWLVVTYAEHFSSPYFIQHMGIHLLRFGRGTEQL